MTEPPNQEGVGRGFALAVFGMVAYIILYFAFGVEYEGQDVEYEGQIGLAKSWYGRLSSILWGSTFIFFAFRGFWVPEQSPFAKTNSFAAHFPTPMIAGLGAWLIASDDPADDIGRNIVGVTLVILSYAWSFFSDLWSRLHHIRPLKLVGIETRMWAFEFPLIMALATYWIAVLESINNN